MALSVPYSFTASTTISSTEMNANFSALTSAAAGKAEAETINGAWTFSATLTLGATLQLADNTLARPLIKDYAETKTAPSISATVLTLDCELGNVFEVTVNANIATLTFSHWPATGTKGSIEVWFKGNGSTFTQGGFSTVRWPSDVVPTLTTTNGDYTVITFHTFDGGSTVFGIPASLAL